MKNFNVIILPAWQDLINISKEHEFLINTKSC